MVQCVACGAQNLECGDISVEKLDPDTGRLVASGNFSATRCLDCGWVSLGGLRHYIQAPRSISR